MIYKFGIFEAIGIELEYMIVDKDSVDVRPLSDQLFKKVVDAYEDVSRGDMEWSNELVMHVVEIKNPKPEAQVLPLASRFRREVLAINEFLREFNCVLLSAGVHPWMNPDRETKLWPHGNRTIYKTYDRLFGCRGHGWSNLQSMHMNFPFANDEEFEKLHTAIRCVLPLVPALCASSPIIDGKYSGSHSSRLTHYMSNQKKIPSIMGHCVPDYAATIGSYHEQVLYPMYNDVKEIDSEGVLQEEWLNSRGAVPKFERNSIEIRLADIQEAPRFDIAIAWFFEKLLKELALSGRYDQELMRSLDTRKLKSTLDGTVKAGEGAIIEYMDLLNVFGLHQPTTAKDLIRKILGDLKIEDREKTAGREIEAILDKGTLATRILKAHNKNGDLKKIFWQMTECLAGDVFFES